MKKRITIKDIAGALKIHHSTVSRALRNDSRINTETRDRVLAFAREHEYQTNMNAVQLRGTQNNAIALIVPNINHSFFSDIVSELTDIAFRKGFVISVFQTNESSVREEEIINTIIRHNFAGVIASIAKDTTSGTHFGLLSRYAIPLVFFDRVCEDVSAPKVVVDNAGITAQAVGHLAGRGYTRVAHITGSTAINVFRDREKGYLESAQVYGLAYRNSIVEEQEFSIDLGRSLFRKLWDSPERPDAIVSSSILLTTGIMLEARASGIRIPEELGLVSFGTSLTAEIVEPPITYIDQPEAEIAAIAFDLLEKILHQEIAPDLNCTEQLEAKLFVLKSS